MANTVKDITLISARTICQNMADSIADQCDKIIKEDNKIFTDIDSRLDKELTELENHVKKMNPLALEYKQKETEKAKESETAKAMASEMKSLRSDYQKYQLAESKYAKDKDDKQKAEMKRLQKSHDRYAELEKKLSEQQNKISKIQSEMDKISAKMQAASSGYGRFGIATYGQYLNSISKRIENLQNMKMRSETEIANNMRGNKERFVKIYTNPSEVDEIAKTIEYSLVRLTGGVYAKLGDALKEEYFIEVLDQLKPMDYTKYHPFENINIKEKCRTEQEVNGKKYVYYDMDKLSDDAIRKGFYLVLSNALSAIVRTVWKKIYTEYKSRESYKENEKEEMDTDKKRVDMTIEENGVFNNPEDKLNKRDDKKEKQEAWSKALRYLNSVKQDMVNVIYSALTKQLDSDSYYRQLTESKAKTEINKALTSLIGTYGRQLGELNSKVVRRSLDSLDELSNVEATAVSKIIYAAFMTELMDALTEATLNQIGDDEPTSQDEWFLNNLRKTKKEMQEGLRNYKTIKSSSVPLEIQKIMRAMM